MASQEQAVAVDELRMRYGETDVLGGLSFDIARGEVVALLGPNGAGKTTAFAVGWSRRATTFATGAR